MKKQKHNHFFDLFILKQTNPLLTLSVAIIIGLLSGSATILFRHSIHLLRRLIYGSGESLSITLNTVIPWWYLFIGLTLGGLVVGLIIHFFLPQRRPQGIAQIIIAFEKEQYISFRSGFFGVISNLLSLSLGASAGRESPALHLATSISSWFCKLFSLKKVFYRVMIASAISASIAASFGAPIAAIIFALELVIIPISCASFIPVAIAATVGTFITRIYEGRFPAFIIPNYHLIIPKYKIGFFYESPFYIVLGILTGILALLFMKSIFFIHNKTSTIRLPKWIWPAIGGALVSIIGFFYPGVLGVGYFDINLNLLEGLTLSLLIGLLFFKYLATIFTLGLGFGGGIFTPSLFIGSIFGGLIGRLYIFLFPSMGIDYRTYAFAAMAALTGTIFGTPIAFTVIMFELTGDYYLTFFIFLSVISAHSLRKKIHCDSFFETIKHNIDSSINNDSL